MAENIMNQESRFYQTYILPNKFFIDKRRAHYSSLICSRQMTREEALKLLEVPLYDDDTLRNDIHFFRKKLDLTKIEFNNILDTPVKSHYDYPNYTTLLKKLSFLRWVLKK